jgi:hypothetical protein
MHSIEDVCVDGTMHYRSPTLVRDTPYAVRIISHQELHLHTHTHTHTHAHRWEITWTFVIDLAAVCVFKIRRSAAKIKNARTARYGKSGANVSSNRYDNVTQCYLSVSKYRQFCRRHDYRPSSRGRFTLLRSTAARARSLEKKTSDDDNDILPENNTHFSRTLGVPPHVIIIIMYLCNPFRLPEYHTRPAGRCPRWTSAGAKTTVSYPISCQTALANS